VEGVVAETEAGRECPRSGSELRLVRFGIGGTGDVPETPDSGRGADCELALPLLLVALGGMMLANRMLLDDERVLRLDIRKLAFEARVLVFLADDTREVRGERPQLDGG